MNTIDVFHLPGLEADDVSGWDYRDCGSDIRLRFPRLRPAGLERLLQRMLAARKTHLIDLPVAELTQLLGAATDRLACDGSLELAQRSLPALTGYSPAMIRLGLDRMLPGWRTEALHQLLHAELGDPAVLDTFRPRPGLRGIRTRAFGPALAFHIFAGNVPGIAVTSLLRTLLLKAATLGKTAAGEPLLPVLFARALAGVAPGIGDCLAITYWPGGDAELEEAVLRNADTVIVYGAAETQSALRRRVPPGVRIVSHGPRFSVGLIGRHCLQPDRAAATAAAVAYAVAVFDQQGCVSPHLFYVEQGSSIGPEDFAELLGAELDKLRHSLPRGEMDPAAASAVHQTRGRAEFRAAESGAGRVIAGPGTEYTVVFDPDPRFEASPLNRFVRVKPVDRLHDAVEQLRGVACYLQTVGVAGAGDDASDLAEELGRAGASRIASLLEMPWPPPFWHHDGQEPLRELLRWADLEPTS